MKTKNANNTFLSRFVFVALVAVWAGINAFGQNQVNRGPTDLAYADQEGVIRWKADDREVALFGANYSLPSSCDYRAAGYVGSDRKKLVEKDMTHFARMGWDGMRLCLWGDWENSDKNGNLIVNDHLDVMDYAIAQAKERGIYILLTPITTYSSLFPDGKDSDELQGFSKYYKKGELGTNPDAIAAQCNYLRQMLNHVNPYTGVALKDDPAILFVEMINEPAHHSGDFAGSVAYINALADAVRSTGCHKILFHNVSQDFKIAPAIKASKVQGASFAWYPTGLNARHMLTENYLRTVDDFAPMLRPDLLNVPKIVYEFDSADMNSGYMYPAMVRSFRSVGVQFIAMFSYDMLDTAPYNLGWQTHFLNMVYSPKKAVSAIIAAEAARVVPRYKYYGDYPDNRTFGPFRVSYEEDLGEMVTDEKFMYSNDTQTSPPKPASLKKIVGFGSSPVVAYEGRGIYFLDKLADGTWRLEVYPDALIVRDPFAQRLDYQHVCSRLVARQWPMTIRLPDLGGSFKVLPLNAGNTYSASARNGRFEINPGVYVLSKSGRVQRNKLPKQIGHLKIDEFVCPEPPKLPAQVVLSARAEYMANQPVEIAADVVDSKQPQEVTLYVRQSEGASFKPLPMQPTGGYTCRATIPVGTLSAGPMDYFISVKTGGSTARFPSDGAEQVWKANIVTPSAPLQLFSAEQDANRLAYTRIGDAGRRGISQSLPASGADPAALRLFFPLSSDRGLDDYTGSLSIKDEIADRRPGISSAKALDVKARGVSDGQEIYLTLVEADGTSWSKTLTLKSGWEDIAVPLDQLKIALGVKLPLGFPERWNYWITPAKGRGGPDDHVRPDQVERLQFSFRPSAASRKAETDPWADIASVTMLFK